MKAEQYYEQGVISYDHGRVLHDQGKYKEAVSEYDQAIKHFSKAIRLKPYLAGKRGLTSCEEGALFGTSGVLMVLSCGLLGPCLVPLMRINEPSQSQSRYGDIYSKIYNAYLQRGHSYMYLGQFNLAENDYAYVLNSGLTEFQLENGTKLIEKHWIDEKMLEMKFTAKEQSDICDYRGYACYRQGKYKQAIADLNKAIKLNSTNNEAYEDIGRVHYAQGHYNDAIAEYNKALELNSARTVTYKLRGDAYARLGKHILAMLDYNYALDIDSNYNAVYDEIKNVRNELEQTNPKFSKYAEAIRKNPNDTEAYVNLGIAYYNEGLYRQAIENYTYAIKIEPSAEIYKRRGEAYTCHGDYSSAIKDYTRMIEINANDARAFNLRGFAHEQLKEFTLADHDYKVALTIAERDKDTNSRDYAEKALRRLQNRANNKFKQIDDSILRINIDMRSLERNMNNRFNDVYKEIASIDRNIGNLYAKIDYINERNNTRITKVQGQLNNYIQEQKDQQKNMSN